MSMGFLIDQTTHWYGEAPWPVVIFNKWFSKQIGLNSTIYSSIAPGTGDILLTMAQKVPISGVILITTPQCLSVNDCMKGVGMLKKCNYLF